MGVPLKASGWWNYKIPPMLAVAYYAIAVSPSPPPLSAMLFPFAVYIIAVIGIAGFGHVFLDIFDVEEDRILGKTNLWSPLSPLARVAVIGSLLAASLLPWLVLPLNRAGVVFLALEFVMFFLYAVPPIRLKNRGFAGIVADSMYAHVLPALWTWIPFSILCGSRAPRWFPFALSIWAFTVGVRHLLQHQIIQLDDDAVAGARTHAVRAGRDSTLNLIIRRFLPLEALAFAALLVTIGNDVPLVPAAFLFYALWQVIKFRVLWLSRLSFVRDTPAADRVTVAGTLVMTRFYERWLPVLLALFVAVKAPEYTLLLAIHVILFTTAFRDMMDDWSLLADHLRSAQWRGSHTAK